MFTMKFFAGRRGSGLSARKPAAVLCAAVSLAVSLAVCFAGCAGSPSRAGNESSAQEAEAAAMAALRAMDNGGSVADSVPGAGGEPPPAGLSAESAPSAPSNSNAGGEAGTRTGEKPAWVDSPYAVYDSRRYVAAAGFGGNRLEAEQNAFANITGVFGQSVEAEMETVSRYNEAVKNGAIQVTENNSVNEAISTSAEMDSLVGAEIADVWFDSKSTYYAIAVMEKTKTAVLYADLIHSNERIINDLITMDPAERNTLAAYSRCLLAATIADANRVYANVLTVVGNSSGIKPAEMKKGDEYRLQAAEIARNIPIGVSVNGDTARRISSAFSRALTRLGFRSGGNNARYVLDGTYTAANAQLENQRNVFVRYNLIAELKDSSDGTVLHNYNASGREGHLNQAEAEERALRAAENKITDEFGISLQEYLSVLLPAFK